MNLDEMMQDVSDIAHAEIERNKALDSQRSVNTEYLRLIGRLEK